MQINIQNNQPQPTPQGGKTVIAQNIKREREMLDKEGNIIDPRTRQVIKRNGDNQ